MPGHRRRPARPCTDTLLSYQPGTGTIEIDHVVSLFNAWTTGARDWDAATRTAFGNDTANLLAVSAAANQDKGGSDAEEWTPPSAAFGCSYAAIQISIKHTYDLWVTPHREASTHRPAAAVPVTERTPGREHPGCRRHADHRPRTGHLYAGYDTGQTWNGSPVLGFTHTQLQTLIEQGDGTGKETYRRRDGAHLARTTAREAAVRDQVEADRDSDEP